MGRSPRHGPVTEPGTPDGRMPKRRGHPKGSEAVRALEAERVFDLRAAGRSWDEIAAETGLARSTTQRRYKQALDSHRPDPALIDEYRATQLADLALSRGYCRKVIAETKLAVGGSELAVALSALEALATSTDIDAEQVAELAGLIAEAAGRASPKAADALNAVARLVDVGKAEERVLGMDRIPRPLAELEQTTPAPGASSPGAGMPARVAEILAGPGPTAAAVGAVVSADPREVLASIPQDNGTTLLLHADGTESLGDEEDDEEIEEWDL